MKSKSSNGSFKTCQDLSQIEEDYRQLIEQSRIENQSQESIKLKREKNLSWSRVIYLQELFITGVRVFKIDEDIEDMFLEISNLSQNQDSDWEPIYDPKESPIADDLDSVSEYQLNADQLKTLGEEVTLWRTVINYKADFLEQNGYLCDHAIDGKDLVEKRLKMIELVKEKAILK